MEQQRNCPTVLLSDDPASEDAFSSHDPVARAIADLVRHEAGGKIIGIEGGWGSGKSTIISLLCQHLGLADGLTRKKPYAVMVFDAWAHEGDRLRRTFLECLIAYLKPWIVGKRARRHWDDRLEALAGRSKEVFSESQPRLTITGALLMIAILLIPVGAALIGAGVRSDLMLWHRGLPLARDATVGFALALSPIVILFACLFLSALVSLAQVQWLNRKETFCTHWRKFRELFARRSGSYLCILVQKSEGKNYERIIESPDPSSVDFARSFRELIQETLNGNQKRLVLVLDNLDRISPSQALSIWSTLQTFVQHEKGAEGEFKKLAGRVWVIVPYDREGIGLVWQTAPNAGEDTGVSNKGTAPQSSRLEGVDPAAHFLDKTFQIRFQVPPPVLSRWRGYLLECLREAFERHCDEKGELDFDNIYRLLWLERRDRLLSPRELKLFVNQIGSLHRQWQDSFPLHHLAYYVLLRRRMDQEEIVSQLVKGDLPEESRLHILGDGEKVHDSLAALVFNVEVEKALEIMMPQRIMRTLEGRPFLSLSELSKDDCFWQSLEDIPLESWLTEDQVNLGKAAHEFSDGGVLDNAPNPMIAEWVKSTFRHVAETRDTWALHGDSAPGICDCLSFLPDDDFARHLLARISSSPMEGGGQVDGPVPPDLVERWLRALCLVLQKIDDLQLSRTYESGIQVPCDINGYLMACEHLTVLDPERKYWSAVRPRVGNDAIGEALSTAAPDGVFDSRHSAAIQVLVSTGNDIDWPSVIQSVSARIELPETPLPEVGHGVTALLHLLRSVPEAKATIEKLAAQGYLLHHFHRAASTGDTGVASLLMMLFLLARPDASPDTHTGQSQPGHQHLLQVFANPPSDLVQAFIEVCISWQQLPLMLTVLDANESAKPLVVACIRGMLDKSEVLELMPPDVFVGRYSFLEADLPEPELNALVARLVADSDLLSFMCSGSFGPRPLALCLRLVRLGYASNAGYADWCSAELKCETLPWAASLREDSDLAWLVVELVSRGIPVELGESYRQGLLDHSRLVLKDRAPRITLWDRWADVIQPLGRGVTELKEGILAEMRNARGRIGANFFRLYGGLIADPLILSEKTTVREVFIPLVQNRQAKGKEWLSEFLAVNPTFAEDYRPQAAIEDLRKTVRKGLRRHLDPKASEALRQLAELLNVKR